MARKKPLTINTTKAESSLEIIPDSPLLSSRTATWNGIQLSYYQHATAFETPEHCFPQHLLTIHYNPIAVIKEQKLEGCLRCDRFQTSDICLTPAMAPVSVRLHDACEVMHLYLEPAFMAQITAEVADVDRLQLVPQFKLNDPLIHQIAIALRATLESNGKWDRLYTESMATALSAHLLQHYSTQHANIRSNLDGLSQTRLQQATEYIHAHAAQNPSLTEIAQTVQMSPYYFSRLFKQSVGLTPHQYLIQCRVEQAERLLKTTHLSIATIAAHVGFVDQSHLARHFKRQFGIPPSQYREWQDCTDETQDYPSR